MISLSPDIKKSAPLGFHQRHFKADLNQNHAGNAMQKKADMILPHNVSHVRKDIGQRTTYDEKSSDRNSKMSYPLNVFYQDSAS